MAADAFDRGRRSQKHDDMNKLLTLGLLGLTSLPMCAQDIYKIENFAGEDLNGTARYVGMGGSMSALGAEISTMGTNPAGTALYRRSDFAMSAGMNSQPNALDFANRGKTRASFDQAGFVYAARMSSDDNLRFINLGFNYHKRRNMKSFVGVDDFYTGGLSQTHQMLDLTYVNNGFLDLTKDNDRSYTTPLTLLGYDTQLLYMNKNADGTVAGYDPVDSQSYNYRRAQWGGIQQYDFNLSFNFCDQVYAGMTFGLYNVDVHNRTDYAEMIIDPANPGQLHEYNTSNAEALTGTGFDVKFGVILRPIEESPFRIGVAVHTPVFYDLTSSQYLYVNSPFKNYDSNGNLVANYTDKSLNVGDNDYKIRTPWKFNLSMATTVGSFLALNAEYEYRDYGASQVRYPGYDDNWSSGEKDEALCNEAQQYLKPVSTIKVGAELRAADDFYLRAGYNWESAPMSKDAFLNLFTSSPSYYYSANTDYLNLSSINRFTCGLGYRGKHAYFDMAYQFQKQTGDFYAFHVPTETSNVTNRLAPSKVDLNRHQVLFTLGYKF